MTTDLDIYRSANRLVKQHGQDAPIEAAMKADELLEAGDLGGAIDVEIGGHSYRIRVTSATASEAVMSGRARRTARTASSVWLR